MGIAVTLVDAKGAAVTLSGSAVVQPSTPRSGSITLGGTAQDLMPANTGRRGWEFQNQSPYDMRIRSKGDAGTDVAGNDQYSFLVPSGATYDPPQITINALSVWCATTGAVFFCKEW